MSESASKEYRYFELAFELAYCIHANKEVAFFVAEDALDGLASMLGYQEKNRKSPQGLRGFFKWGERSRPIRKTLKLNEPQMLQWLVYKHSESWERQTERGEGIYLPTEEDLIVRYIEYLIFISLRRGSFYVTLVVSSLLHQFNRRETRLFYDILTQSDPARMKDANYIGKQRLEMLGSVSRRFDHMLQTVKKPGDETQFVMRPTTQRVINLVNESLRRFTPWGTTCAVEPGFDVTDIPGLYFSETGDNDEELIEMNRISTVLDPLCFARFVDGLAKYVSILPEEDQDKGCNYDSPDERLTVPQFSNFPGGTPRDDRFQSPQLVKEDYIRLQRTLDARARRRKAFTPLQLCIYIDGVLSHSFDPKTRNRFRCLLTEEAGVIEVRGRDFVGEMTLVMLLLDDEQFPGETFRDSVVYTGGQKITVRLAPLKDSGGAVTGTQLDMSYAGTSLIGATSLLFRRVWSRLTGMKEESDGAVVALKQGPAWWVKGGVALALTIVIVGMFWWQFPLVPSQREVKPPESTSQPQSIEPGEEKNPVASFSPSPPPKPSPTANKVRTLFARASWSMDREAALHAVSVEPTRGESLTIDLSNPETKVMLSLPLYDDEGRTYSHYRLTLAAAEKRLWRQTLRAPKVSLTGYAHILTLSLSTRRLHETRTYNLRVEGRIQTGWRQLGYVMLSPKNQ